ncbi:unnamed protein product [Durusdinium trenchii]|uniref:Uncharacterized protein n=1 Tax=Durusdinium trenchii TaxID=1381693 RepID=A0ABP0Q109_9DINO
MEEDPRGEGTALPKVTVAVARGAATAGEAKAAARELRQLLKQHCDGVVGSDWGVQGRENEVRCRLVVDAKERELSEVNASRDDALWFVVHAGMEELEKIEGVRSMICAVVREEELVDEAAQLGFAGAFTLDTLTSTEEKKLKEMVFDLAGFGLRLRFPMHGLEAHAVFDKAGAGCDQECLQNLEEWSRRPFVPEPPELTQAYLAGARQGVDGAWMVLEEHQDSNVCVVRGLGGERLAHALCAQGNFAFPGRNISNALGADTTTLSVVGALLGTRLGFAWKRDALREAVHSMREQLMMSLPGFRAALRTYSGVENDMLLPEGNVVVGECDTVLSFVTSMGHVLRTVSPPAKRCLVVWSGIELLPEVQQHRMRHIMEDLWHKFMPAWLCAVVMVPQDDPLNADDELKIATSANASDSPPAGSLEDLMLATFEPVPLRALAALAGTTKTQAKAEIAVSDLCDVINGDQVVIRNPEETLASLTGHSALARAALDPHHPGQTFLRKHWIRHAAFGQELEKLEQCLHSYEWVQMWLRMDPDFDQDQLEHDIWTFLRPLATSTGFKVTLRFLQRALPFLHDVRSLPTQVVGRLDEDHPLRSSMPAEVGHQWLRPVGDALMHVSHPARWFRREKHRWLTCFADDELAIVLPFTQRSGERPMVFNVDNGQFLFSLLPEKFEDLLPEKRLHSIGSPDGEGAAGREHLWIGGHAFDKKSGKPFGRQVRQASFLSHECSSPDGRRIYLATGNVVRVMDDASRELVCTLRCDQFDFTPDEQESWSFRKYSSIAACDNAAAATVDVGTGHVAVVLWKDVETGGAPVVSGPYGVSCEPQFARVGLSSRFVVATGPHESLVLLSASNLDKIATLEGYGRAGDRFMFRDELLCMPSELGDLDFLQLSSDGSVSLIERYPRVANGGGIVVMALSKQAVVVSCQGFVFLDSPAALSTSPPQRILEVTPPLYSREAVGFVPQQGLVAFQHGGYEGGPARRVDLVALDSCRTVASFDFWFAHPIRTGNLWIAEVQSREKRSFVVLHLKSFASFMLPFVDKPNGAMVCADQDCESLFAIGLKFKQEEEKSAEVIVLDRQGVVTTLAIPSAQVRDVLLTPGFLACSHDDKVSIFSRFKWMRLRVLHAGFPASSLSIKDGRELVVKVETQAKKRKSSNLGSEVLSRLKSGSLSRDNPITDVAWSLRTWSQRSLCTQRPNVAPKRLPVSLHGGNKGTLSCRVGFDNQVDYEATLETTNDYCIVWARTGISIFKRETK